ncbi:zinc finger protein 271-like [Ylistrum balloti]|uniref:zinc finger protein 271-like n=1 Tax=Ylistrum balloti TaxID=509963 RepID=UPI0029059310|nr:zinc finger protein 271-like [Ylistrum balloti]
MTSSEVPMVTSAMAAPTRDPSAVIDTAAHIQETMAALDENQPFYTKQGENFMCNLCDKSFNYKNGLIRHLRLTHGKEKPFECNICHRRFGYKNILMEHQNIHFGIKPYACNLCDKRFAARSNLVQHKLVHRKPFSCTICTKRFDKPEQLQRHLLGHPGGVLSCNLCSFSTTNQLSLNDHIQKNHPPQVMDTKDKHSSNFDTSSIENSGFTQQKGTLPQFGVAFNFSKMKSPSQQMKTPSPSHSGSSSPMVSSSPGNDLGVDSIRRIDSICANLASRNPSVLSQGDISGLSHGINVKQEPQSPCSDSADSAHFMNPGLSTPFGHNMSMNHLNQQRMQMGGYSGQFGSSGGSHRGRSQSTDNAVLASAVINVESTQPGSVRHNGGQTKEAADSTSNVSEVLSMLQTLARRSEEEGPGKFPQISITISHPKNNVDKATQFTQHNPSAPNLQDTLAYYEAQGKIYRCQHCRILFEERGLYFLHVALHGSPNPWECSICHTVFADRNDFHLHLINQQHCHGTV